MALGLVAVLLGGLAYYDYAVTNQLEQRNSSLATEETVLQNYIAQLQYNVTQLHDSITGIQGALNQSWTEQSYNSQQVADAQVMIQHEQTELSKLSSEVRSLQAGNITELALISGQLQSVNASVQDLQADLQPIYPAIFLRTSGAGLASFIEGTDEQTYLRLTENGPTSGVEAAIASQPFNASVANSSVEWKAVTNSVAADENHRYWPMVLENCPAGTDALEFSDSLGAQQAAVVLNGVRTFVSVSWNSTIVNTFRIVVVTPGHRVDFYIDGNLVATITTGIPTDDFLLKAAEVGGYGTSAPGIAILDTYGGILDET